MDEFQVFDQVIQKSEDALKRSNTIKKLRTDNNDISNDGMESFIRNIITTELDDFHEKLANRDELVKKLCHRLHLALKNNNAIKKSELTIAKELQEMKNELQQFSTYVNQCKNDSTLNKINQTNNNNSLQFFVDDESSLELCRKQILNQSSFLSQIDYNHIDSMNNSACDKLSFSLPNNDNQDFQKTKNNPNHDKTENTNVQLLIEQIKTLENKIHTERESYLEENERLNSVIDEKQKIIDEYETKLNGKSINNLNHNNTGTTNALNGSLFDWHIEDTNQYDSLTNIVPYANGINQNSNYHQMNDYSNNSFQTNNRLLVVLSDLVKTFLDTENDIQKQLEQLGLEKQQHPSSNIPNQARMVNGKGSPLKTDDLLAFSSLEDERFLLSTSEIPSFELCEDGPDLTTPSSILYTNSNSLNNTIGSTTIGTSGNNSNDIEDDVVLGASRRLRFAVERVLKILTDTLDHQKNDFNELLKQKDDLMLECQEECQRSDKLAQQLMEKENIIKNLENEKKNLTEKLIDHNEIKDQYDRLKEKLEEFETERDKFIMDNKRLEIERKSFDQGLPKLHQKLLYENDVLNKDLRALQQEKKKLLAKITKINTDLENVKTEKEQLIESKNAEFAELTSQLDSNQKNLNSLKRFIDEQTQEREMEREEFNKEVKNIKDKIKEMEKYETKLKSNIRSLESQLALVNDEKAAKDEQLDLLNNDLKEANSKLNDLNLIKRQLESESERNAQMEKNLQDRLKNISNALQVKLNDETSWDEVMYAIDQLIVAKSDPSGKNSVLTKVNRLEAAQVKESLDNSIFSTIKKMDDKILDLKKNIKSLMGKNDNLIVELKNKNELIEQLEQFKPIVQTLEANMKELTKTNDLLQQEINAGHMKYTELKVKLDSSVDILEFKRTVNDLQTKLNNEKKLSEATTMKYEQANRHVNELTEKLDAYKKEIKSFKELLKSHENSDKNSFGSKEKISDVRNSKDLTYEINSLSNKLEVKERTISLLEQNIEILKSKLDSVTSERDIYSERIKLIDDSKNAITIYEKNLEKLRLQYKISTDKITYLELEIQNFKKKIDLLEKENEMLKVENQRMVKQKQEMNACMYADYVDAEQTEMLMNGASNGIYLNGLDKMNNISSNNLLMLKVRRLLTQKGALIYQKKYLIHLLNSYQRTENDTLELLANFNNSKDPYDDEVKMRGKFKFRSIVYALIALNRMKYMVNIWQCRKRQLLFHKTANSIASLQNVPLPPKKMPKENINILNLNKPGQITNGTASNVHQHLKYPANNQINSTLKDYVDRLHVVHETLGLHTNKRL